MTRFLAIDYGGQNIGLARNDPLNLCSPLPVLVRKTLEHDLQQLKHWVELYEIEGIILGYPYHMDGTTNIQTTRVQVFAAQLKNYLHKQGLILPFYFFDERLTTWEAGQQLYQKKYRGNKLNKKIDSQAACLILEGYLASLGSSNL